MTMLKLNVQIDTGNIVVVVGRAAWALLQLMAAGDTGCSYIDNPAPRWSGYIYKLRKMGVVIDTVREAHSGQFSGHHARYVLRSHVIVIDTTSGG